MRLLHAVAAAASIAVVGAATSLEVPVLEPQCDILVAGGSLASVAAAITAANISAGQLKVCYTDVVDWPGGQATASAVPAIDYGPANRPAGATTAKSPNNAAAFMSMLWTVATPELQQCWVSETCFQPQDLLPWLWDALSQFGVAYYPNTVIINATRNSTSGAITSLTAVQRTPVPGTTGWERLTSAQVTDWYSPQPSAAFTKTIVVFRPRVVIEATEFGDVLMTSGVGVAQGIEAPYENSSTYIDYCGQGTTIPIFMTYGTTPAPAPDPWPPGDDCGYPYTLGNDTWERIWTYRRSSAVPNATYDSASPTETSNQNWGGGNDYDVGYLLLPLEAARAQVAAGSWAGGINTTAYAAAEQRAYGWYHWYKAAAPANVAPYLTLNTTQTGTSTGLAKMPYLRDTRRAAAGINGFRLFYEPLNNCSDPGPLPPSGDAAAAAAAAADVAGGACATGYEWADVVGIGQYFYADCHRMIDGTCPYPDYFTAGSPVKPYYLPFRALTSADSPNLLVAGKSMAQSFWANAGVRLHPEEWVSGTAAGAAAVVMLEMGYDTAGMYADVGRLQRLLTAFGSPLQWQLPWPPA